MTSCAHQKAQAYRPLLSTSAAVLLVHASLLWMIVQQMASPSLQGAHEQIILASVVAEAPSKTIQAAAFSAPLPASLPGRNSATASPPPQRLAAEPSTTPASRAAEPGETSPSVPVAAAPQAASSTTTGITRPASPSAAAVVLPSTDADYLNNPPPAYPRMSRRMGEQGTVLVHVFINAEGRADKVEIGTSSGYPRLDEVALETVERWRYVPGKRAGVAEAMWFNVPIRFVLD